MAQRQAAMRPSTGRAHNEELEQIVEHAKQYRDELVATADVGDVSGQIERYITAVERLDRTCSRLEDRLGPVCRPSPSSVDALLAERRPLVPMAETLAETTGRLEGLTIRLDELEAGISL